MEKLRRVLVTGASKGIGAAIARRLAARGFFVGVHYRASQEQAETVLADITKSGGAGSLLNFDIGDRAQTREVLIQEVAENGAFYGVVCNAGIARDAAFPALSEHDWDGVLHTNLDGFYNVLHPLVMPMIRLRTGGRIVTLSSVSGVAGNRGQVNYSAAKAGIIGATKALALELAKRKITVNCIAPGVISTDMTASLEQDAQTVEHIKKTIPLGVFGKPEHVAATTDFLLSDDAAYITRQVIQVNGGMC